MKDLKTKLISFYDSNKRDLPWRKTRDPYRILLSEIMLQQTIVNVVIPYYEKFLREFPTIQDLARAPEEKVLSLWSGLGYYSRARNLQKAAQAIEERGAFPKKYEDLLDLPGVGPYTAAAVASIAFGEPVAAIDGNVNRVISRLFDVEKNIQSKEGQKEIREKAQLFISGQDPSKHNQAVMELGATICTPLKPACLLCPLTSLCKARAAGTVMQRPVKDQRRPQEPWLWTLYYAEKRGQKKRGKPSKIAFVRENNGTPWLKTTWVLPGVAKAIDGRKTPDHDFKHSITHHKIFVRVQRILDNELDNLTEAPKVKWMTLEEVSNLGVSSIVHKALRHINQAGKRSNLAQKGDQH